MNAITPKDIRDWQNQQIDTGYSAAYLDRIQNMMTTIMNYAVTYYNLPANPCNRVGHMEKRTLSMNFRTLNQFNNVMEHITYPSATVALKLLFYSGMRFGEMMALTMDDFNFTAHTISVTKTLHHTATSDLVPPPKTENGIRTISIPASASLMQEVR